MKYMKKIVPAEFNGPNDFMEWVDGEGGATGVWVMVQKYYAYKQYLEGQSEQLPIVVKNIEGSWAGPGVCPECSREEGACECRN